MLKVWGLLLRGGVVEGGMLLRGGCCGGESGRVSLLLRTGRDGA